ncbi:hypothetical protein WJX82_008593 [Trebouxia sp. C0006]
MNEVKLRSNGPAVVNQQLTSTPEDCCFQGHGITGFPKSFSAAQGDVNNQNHGLAGESYNQDNPAFTNTSTFPAATGHSVAVNEPYQTSTHSGHPYSSKTGPGYSMHTEAIQGSDFGPVAASTITTGSTANTIAKHGSTTAQAGSPNKVSSASKGARYDETDGAIDDRTGMQKLADKLSPGSAVGKHTSDVAGWAPNAGPSHGYNTGDGPTRFTAGHVASDYEGNVSNSRNDITGPTAYAATITADKGNTLPFDKPPHYITNEFGDVVGIEAVQAVKTGTSVPAALASCLRVVSNRFECTEWPVLQSLTAALGRPSSLAPGPRSAKLSGGARYDAGALDDRIARDACSSVGSHTKI